MKNFLRGILTALSVFVILIFANVAVAEVQTFEGTGEYIMSDFEVARIAEERARQTALHNACEKAAIYVELYCHSNDIKLTDDEIAAIVNNIIRVTDVQIHKEPVEFNGERVIAFTATVKASIDLDDIYQYIAVKMADD